MLTTEAATQYPLILGVSGASGALLFDALADALLRSTALRLEVILTESAQRVRNLEILDAMLPQDARIHYLRNDDLAAPCASGSHLTSGMVVAPCSMATLAKISHGIADSLLTRAADVTLKEGRRLVLVPRETPLSTIHLENMLRLSRLGVIIAPPMLTMYHGKSSVQDQVEQHALHIVELLGYSVPRARWGEGLE